MQDFLAGRGSLRALYSCLQIQCFVALLQYQQGLAHPSPAIWGSGLLASQALEAGVHRPSESLEGQVDDFADLLYLERRPEEHKATKPFETESAIETTLSQHVVSLMEEMQLWQMFNDIVEAGRCKAACQLLVEVVKRLCHAQSLRQVR